MGGSVNYEMEFSNEMRNMISCIFEFWRRVVNSFLRWSLVMKWEFGCGAFLGLPLAGNIFEMEFSNEMRI